MLLMRKRIQSRQSHAKVTVETRTRRHGRKQAALICCRKSAGSNQPQYGYCNVQYSDSRSTPVLKKTVYSTKESLVDTQKRPVLSYCTQSLLSVLLPVVLLCVAVLMSEMFNRIVSPSLLLSSGTEYTVLWTVDVSKIR
jgi:hypothetical protein